MNDEREYWYFRLVRETFTSPQMWKLKELRPRGYMYMVVYLEMCCLSVTDKGFIRIPRTSALSSFSYDLSERLQEPENDVKEAVNILTRLGLIELSEGIDAIEIKVPKVINNIGRSSRHADEVRKYRAEQLPEGDSAMQLPEVSTAEQDQIADGYKKYGKYKNVILADSELSELQACCKNMKSVVEAINILSGMKKDSSIDYTNISDFQRCMKLVSRVGERRG